MSNKIAKTSQGMSRRQEQEASRRFGHHVSPEKALAAAIATTICCALPMLLGLRLWDRIPPIVETGLVGPGGQDDSMPRAVLVFGVPGLGVILNAIVHGQLWLHQRAEKVPPTPVRLLGRWSIPPVSVLLSSYWIRSAAGESKHGMFMSICALGLILLILGGHFFDCPQDAVLAFRVPHKRQAFSAYMRDRSYTDSGWRTLQRIAGCCWMAAGLLILALLFLLGIHQVWSMPIILLLLAVPAIADYLLRLKNK